MAWLTTSISLPDNNHNRAPGFIACVSVFSVTALILVALRLYVRLRIVRLFGADDFATLLAMVCIPATPSDCFSVDLWKITETDLLYRRPLLQRHASLTGLWPACYSFDSTTTNWDTEMEFCVRNANPCWYCHVQHFGQPPSPSPARESGGSWAKVLSPRP